MFVNASYVVSDVANVLNLSERQVQRLMNSFRQNGADGLIHQSRGSTDFKRNASPMDDRGWPLGATLTA